MSNLDLAIREVQEALNYEINLMLGDFITAERITSKNYIQHLDDADVKWEHPDGEWTVEFTSDHQVVATRTKGVDGTSYNWYFKAPALTSQISVDVTEMLEDQIGA